MLKRTITKKQWLSLGILFVGICLVQLNQHGTKKTLYLNDPYLGDSFTILIVNLAYQLVTIKKLSSACYSVGPYVAVSLPERRHNVLLQFL